MKEDIVVYEGVIMSSHITDMMVMNCMYNIKWFADFQLCELYTRHPISDYYREANTQEIIDYLAKNSY